MGHDWSLSSQVTCGYPSYKPNLCSYIKKMRFFWPKELPALAGGAEEARAMRAAAWVGGITLTKPHTLLSLSLGDPLVCPPAGLFQLPWLSSVLAGLVSRGGSQHSSALLPLTGYPSDCAFLPCCRKDLECQGHDGQHWPLQGLRVRQL